MQHSDAIEIALNYEKAAEETFRRLYYLRQAEAEALFPPLSSNGQSEASSSSGERRARPLTRFHPHPHSGPYPHHHHHHHRATQTQPAQPNSQSAEQAQEVAMYADDEFVDYSEEEFSEGEEYDEGDDAMDQDEPERPAAPKQEDMMEDEDENPTPPEELEEVFCTRMVRIQSWRHTHSESPLSAERASAEELNLIKDLKRKSSPEPSSDAGRSVTKRARSACGVAGGYHCTACGSSFSTKFTLRRHGKGVRTSPACRAAVSYQFE